MGDTKKFRDEKLPVTAEVGGEGGSFADPTYQQSATEGYRGLHRESDTEAPNAASEVAGNAEHRPPIADGGVGTNPDPAEGMKKYPSEE
jgi:hypothetical protein